MTPERMPAVTRCGAGQTLWHGRFASGPAEELMAYTVSLPFDRQLWRDDIAGSRAHVDDARPCRHPRPSTSVTR